MRILLVILCLLIIGNPVFAWDGDWTEGQSGVEPNLYDEGNSDTKSGLDGKYEFFYIPPVPQWEQVDWEELQDNRKGNKSPYVILQIPQPVKFRGQWLTKGYYLVKIGDSNDGSPSFLAPPNQRWNRTLILKQYGTVKAVLPITQIAPSLKKKREQPRAWIENNTLKVYSQKLIYEAPFDPQ